MEKTIARSQPHACPVCKGRGELTEELAQHASKIKHDLQGRKIYACHVCLGAGIVWEIYEMPTPEITSGIGVMSVPQPPQPTPYFPPQITVLGSTIMEARNHDGMNYGTCACSDTGTPHSDNCKAG